MSKSLDNAQGELLAQIDEALSQAQDCIRGETPENITDSEAREDTINKVREAMRSVEALRAAPVPQCDAEIDTLRKALIEARAALQTLDHMNGNSSGLEVIRGGKTIGSIIDDALVSPPSEAGREAREKQITRLATIEECAQLIESGAGMADLIDQDDLDQQAKYIRALSCPEQGTVTEGKDQ